VDFPEPEVPTTYVRSREGKYNEILSRTRRSGLAGYAKET